MRATLAALNIFSGSPPARGETARSARADPRIVIVIPIDRPTQPNTAVSSDASDDATDARAAAGPSGSGVLEPSGPLAFLPTRPPETPGAPRGQRDHAVWLGGAARLRPEALPIVRGPRHGPRALVQQLEAMRLHDATGASRHDADHTASDANDDFLVLADSTLAGTPDFWAGGARRAQRLDALSEWVACASIGADAHALAAGADELRRQMTDRHPITFTADFQAPFRNPASQLPKIVFECEDAGRAWQNAADHYRAALDAAHKVGLAAEDIARLDEAAAHCEAHTTRLVIKTALLHAILEFRRGRYRFEAGHPRLLDVVLEPLRRALDHCGANALRALPLGATPIEGFDAELRTLAEAVGTVSNTVELRASTIEGPPGMRPPELDAGAASTLSELAHVLNALPHALRGEPDVQALLHTLRSTLATSMDYARDLLVQAEARRNDPSRSLDSLMETFESWSHTAHAYDDALRAFDDATASWPEAARSAPEARQPRAELSESLHAAIRRMNDALVDLFSTMSAALSDLSDRDADPSERMEAVTVAEPSIGPNLFRHCQTLRRKLEAATFPRHAAEIDTDRLAAPFIALEQYIEAVLDRRRTDLLGAANDVRQAASTAERAAVVYGRALGPALRQFSTLCARQRTKLLYSAFDQVHAESVQFSVQASVEMGPALARMHELRQSLPLVWFDASGTDRAAAQEAQAADEALIASTREAVRRIDMHVAQMPSPPADAPEHVVDDHAVLRLNLNAQAGARRAMAELIEYCGKARRAIHDGPTADCTTTLRRLAGAMRQAEARAADVLVLARDKRLTRGAAGEQASSTLRFTRRVERTANCIRYTLDVLADLSQGYRRVQDLCREPTLDPLRFQETAAQLTDDVDRAAKDIDATLNQWMRQVGTRHPDAGAAALAKQDIEQIQSFMVRLEWRYIADFDAAKRQWLRATVRALAGRLADSAGTAPPHAGSLLDLIDQHLAASTKILIKSAPYVQNRERIDGALRENHAIGREAQDCREQLQRVPARPRAASEQPAAAAQRSAANAAGPSRPDSRKDKKASGKTKRR